MNKWKVIYFALELNCTIPIIDALYYNTPYQLRSNKPNAEEWKMFVLSLCDYCHTTYQCVIKPYPNENRFGIRKNNRRILWLKTRYPHCIRINNGVYSKWLDIGDLEWRYDGNAFIKCKNIDEFMAKLFESLHEVFTTC